MSLVKLFVIDTASYMKKMQQKNRLLRTVKSFLLQALSNKKFSKPQNRGLFSLTKEYQQKKKNKKKVLMQVFCKRNYF